MPHFGAFVSTEPIVIRLTTDEIDAAIEGMKQAGVADSEMAGLRDRWAKEWISIKPQLGAGAKNAVLNVALDIPVPKNRGDEIDAKLRYGEYLNRVMDIVICNWYLLNDQGNPVDFDRKLIQALDADDPLVDKVLAEIAARYPFGAKKSQPGASS